MTRDSVKDIKKEVAKENDAFYGEETPGGHQEGLDADNDTEITVKKVLGKNAYKTIKKHKPFVLGDN